MVAKSTKSGLFKRIVPSTKINVKNKETVRNTQSDTKMERLFGIMDGESRDKTRDHITREEVCVSVCWPAGEGVWST